MEKIEVKNGPLTVIVNRFQYNSLVFVENENGQTVSSKIMPYFPNRETAEIFAHELSMIAYQLKK